MLNLLHRKGPPGHTCLGPGLPLVRPMELTYLRVKRSHNQTFHLYKGLTQQACIIKPMLVFFACQQTGSKCCKTFSAPLNTFNSYICECRPICHFSLRISASSIFPFYSLWGCENNQTGLIMSNCHRHSVLAQPDTNSNAD